MSVMFTVFCSPLTCKTCLHYPFGVDSCLQVAATAVMLQHSGLGDMNPGDAVRMESGETIAQWRKLYFEKFEVGVSYIALIRTLECLLHYHKHACGVHVFPSII